MDICSFGFFAGWKRKGEEISPLCRVVLFEICGSAGWVVWEGVQGRLKLGSNEDCGLRSGKEGLSFHELKEKQVDRSDL